MQEHISFFRLSKSRLPVILFLLLITGPLTAQVFRYTRQIKWSSDELTFKDATEWNGKFGKLPVYTESFPLITMYDSVGKVTIENLVYENAVAGDIIDSSLISSDPYFSFSKTIFKRKPFLNITILPLARGENGIRKLKSFTLIAEIIPGGSKNSLKISPAYAANSVLASGKWFKLFVDQTGIFRLTYNELVALDPDFANADPRTIRIYGNGGGMLPEAITAVTTDDLRELPLFVTGEGDGRLDAGDYILFYAGGPDTWKYDINSKLFVHSKNIYSDLSCYFITYGQGDGKRIPVIESTTQTATNFINRFDDHIFYEKDDKSLLKSGKIWYDKETFDLTTTRTYRFNIPDLDGLIPVNLTSYVAARSTTGSTTFTFTANGGAVTTSSIPPVPTTDFAIYANKVIKTGTFQTSNSDIDIKVTYSKNGNEAIGFLNYLELNAVRHLRFSGSQMSFRSVNGAGPGKVSEFTLSSSGQQITIWDVTDFANVKAINARKTGTDYIFRTATDTLKEFVAFDGSSFHSVVSTLGIENQDLHGAGNYDMLIVTHPEFVNEANELADFHRTKDNLSVLVATPDKIYNEFSSGVQDLTAIRNFAKMLYNRPPQGKELKYILMFGDASYDYKNRVQNNTNLVPTYQSLESLDPINSFVTDDFFGTLENNDSLQVGIGRLPVTTREEARAVLNKIISYTSSTDTVKNDWRNVICFVSDDEDNNIYMNDAEKLTSQIYAKDATYNVSKIFVDAFQQLSTPGGARSPEVNSAINLQMDRGCMIINYIGHGGELGWAHERILEIPDIRAWTNFSRLPVFLTATCEFTRYDDPGLISAGEWVLLNPNGGGIGLFTTTRPTYANENYALSSSFYSFAFNKTNGAYPRMGDIIVSAKNKSHSINSNRRFVLIGDPALRMSYPDLNVVTTSINGVSDPMLQDTIKALATMTINGEIRNDLGQKVSNFNGTVFPTIYDKEADVTTLANDGGTPFKFKVRKNIIYKGKADVKDGEFSFNFIVPKDIAYQYGQGRISYYARSSETDASGYDTGITVGGYNNNAAPDINGPLIRLFMNDTNFVSGGITDQNPKMLALIRDESGINTVGNGIGHDITITLDDNNQNQKIANDYYASDVNTYKSGKVLYPFFNLPDGHHSLRLKIWDIYNNSSEATVDFVVASSAELALDNIFNYPNPLRDHTTFSFEYNRPNTELNVTISIYNFSGQLVTTIQRQMMTSGYRANTINWDGTTRGGSVIGSGNYIYNITISTPDGASVQKASKLVVIR